MIWTSNNFKLYKNNTFCNITIMFADIYMECFVLAVQPLWQSLPFTNVHLTYHLETCLYFLFASYWTNKVIYAPVCVRLILHDNFFHMFLWSSFAFKRCIKFDCKDLIVAYPVLNQVLVLPNFPWIRSCMPIFPCVPDVYMFFSTQSSFISLTSWSKHNVI